MSGNPRKAYRLRGERSSVLERLGVGAVLGCVQCMGIGQGSRRSRIHSFRAFLYASRLLKASTIRSPLGPW